MRNDFAVFVLTHRRAETMYTTNMLNRSTYKGKVYYIIDNEDEQADLYKKKFGAENVIMFDKQKAYENTDSMDNFNIHEAIVYARNETWKIAKQLGLKYFLMFDDDFTSIGLREIKDGVLKFYTYWDFERLFNDMVTFLERSNADTVAFCQGGDLIGGKEGGSFSSGLKRKAMNSFFCRTDRPINFRGTMNEDVVTYTTEGSRGKMFLSITNVTLVPKSTQSVKGGMTDVYLEGGTYLKSFYAVMSMPSCVKVSILASKHKRIHHRVSWDNCIPKILNEKYRKNEE